MELLRRILLSVMVMSILLLSTGTVNEVTGVSIGININRQEFSINEIPVFVVVLFSIGFIGLFSIRRRN
jgi:hypothetical protein